MATLQKLDILSMGRLKTTTVEVEGGQIIVSELGAADSSEVYSDPQNYDEQKNLKMPRFGPALLVRCLVDDDDNRLFADYDVDVVSRMSPALYIKLLNAALDINGLSASAAEEAIKN